METAPNQIIPRQYQLSAVVQIMRRNMLLADECGLGKTLTALLAVKATAYRKRTLIVTPLQVQFQWVKEIERLMPNEPLTLIQYGMPLWMYGRDDGIFLTAYENLRSDLFLMSACEHTWDWLILDEAHRIKNRDAAQSKGAKLIPAVSKLALTGTPIEKSPADLWSILNFLHPHAYTSYWKFFEKYVKYFTFPNGSKKITGVSNPLKLANELKTTMIKRTKVEVAPELPEKIEVEVPLPMNEDQLEVYQTIDVSKDIIVGSDIIQNELSKINLLQQITSGLRSSSVKLQWCVQWAEDNPDVPFIIFAHFRDTVTKLLGQFPEADVIVGGQHTPPIRFLEGRTRVLIGTIDAMSEGLNLQRADVAIFHDMVWSHTKMTQAVDRIHRLGIVDAKVIYYLLCHGTVDYSVRRTVQNKWDMIQLIDDVRRKGSY